MSFVDGDLNCKHFYCNWNRTHFLFLFEKVRISELIATITKHFVVVIFKIVLSISLDFCFSFGILLWSIVTGKQPYARKWPISSNLKSIYFVLFFCLPLNSDFPQLEYIIRDTSDVDSPLTVVNLSFTADAMSHIVKFRIPQGDRPSLDEIRHQAVGVAGLATLMELMQKCWDSKPSVRPDSRSKKNSVYPSNLFIGVGFLCERRGVPWTVHHRDTKKTQTTNYNPTHITSGGSRSFLTKGPSKDHNIHRGVKPLFNFLSQ